MTMRRPLNRQGWVILALFAAPIAGLGVTARAHADQASATWTGDVEARGNAFYERSSRVMVPELSVTATAPNGLRVGAGYLIDVISSASIAQTGTEGDKVFTELRHGVDANVGGEIDLHQAQLDLTANGTYSTEDDYRSFNAGLESTLSLNERATKLRLFVTHVRDRITSNIDPDVDEALRGVTVGVGVEQLITSRLVLSVGYGIAYIEGFLANVYRRALVGPLPFPETHPGERLRHNATTTLTLFVPETDTAFHLSYRAYLDSWDIAALTPELAIYQHFGDDFLVRLRYRYYAQTPAYFFRRSYPVGWQGYVTNDPKMAALQTHTLGVSLELRMSVLDSAWLDFAIERYLSSSVYGNGVIATSGLRLGF